MGDKLLKHKKILLLINALILYFVALNLISAINNVPQTQVLERNIVSISNFTAMTDPQFARVGDSMLEFKHGEGLKEFHKQVSLTEGVAFHVQFTVSVPEEAAGKTLFIDLYGGNGYDNDSSQINHILEAGANQVNGTLPYGDTHPDSCQLRIFTADNIDASISEFQIDRLEPFQGVTDNVTISITLLIIIGILFITLLSVFNPRKVQKKSLVKIEKPIKVTPQKPLTVLDVLLGLLLLCLFTYTVYLILFKLNPYGLNSDVVNEISYRQLSFEQKNFFPENFMNSNESFAGRSVILYWLFYGVTKDFLLSFQLEDICILVLQILSLAFLLYTLKLSRQVILLVLCMYVGWMPVGIAGVLFWPMCAYASYAIMIMLTCALCIKIGQNVEHWKDLKKRKVLLSLFLIFTMAGGFGFTTIKIAMVLYLPLVCINFLRLFFDFIQQRSTSIREIIMFAISAMALIINLVFYGLLLFLNSDKIVPVKFDIAPISNWFEWNVISTQVQTILEALGLRGGGPLGSVSGIQFLVSCCFLALSVISSRWLLKTDREYTVLGARELILYWLASSILMFLIEVCTATAVSSVRYYFVTAMFLPVSCGLALNEWCKAENEKILQWPCVVLTLGVLAMFGTNVLINRVAYSTNPTELVQVSKYIKDNKYEYVTASYWNAGVIKGYTNGAVETQHSADSYGIATLTPYRWLIDQRKFDEERLGQLNILLLTDEEESIIDLECGDVYKLLQDKAVKVTEIGQYNLYSLTENPYTLINGLKNMDDI